MKTMLMFLVAAAMLATLGVLFAGLLGMARNSSGASQNRLMRYRIGLQMLALVLFGLLLAVSRA
jgi:hypothetical protein